MACIFSFGIIVQLRNLLNQFDSIKLAESVVIAQGSDSESVMKKQEKF